MPKIFKALASIMAWAAFVGSWVIIIISSVDSIIHGTMWNPGSEHGLAILGWMVLGIVTGLISVVLMKLRKTLE